ncbi:hypothetical protein TRICI_006399 [Trichomonascus ciferrii]|uniref:GPI transamidase component GPI16 n=1 Tax=Trichomonascus ciferrii TaxID=44093 RepID=A0A642UHH8_9ASCO|nr:hypothetical protein TRICI_006399 [Trichomonascus ciferrii]
MRLWNPFWVWLTVFASLVTYGEASNGYQEHLAIHPLPRNSLLHSFEFESFSSPIPSKEFYEHHEDTLESYSEYTAFPRSVGQIIKQSNTHELHLRFSQGWWDAESWGVQPANGSHAGGIGVELWAWVEAASLEEAESHWRKLVNTLSGFFCASLNFIDHANTALPVKSFQRSESDLHPNPENLYLLHGALPGEPVCTENLTPFLKLLPCKGKAGVSSLLDGHKIFDAQWQGMAIDVVPVCDMETRMCQYKLAQHIDAVVDVPRALSRRTSPVPKPVPESDLRCDTSKEYHSNMHCFPLGESKEVSWNLSDLFGRNITQACQLADNNVHISVSTTSDWNARLVGSDGEASFDGNEFSLSSQNDWDIILQSQDTFNIPQIETPPVLVERAFTGYGQDKGGMRTVFENPSNDREVKFVYFETLPWYMRVYLHTLQLDVLSSPPSESSLARSQIMKHILYRPAKDREQPTQIEIEMRLPPGTSVSLSYDFDKSLLYLAEYPPDANHGFDIAPGVLTTFDDSGKSLFSIRTTSLLLSLPTPDFSMPYNVIILTCTVMALAFGTLFNLLAKEVVPEEVALEAANKRPLNKLVNKVKRKLGRLTAEHHRGPFPYVDTDAEKRKQQQEQKS